MTVWISLGLNAANMSSRSLEYIFGDRASVTMPMFKSYAFGHFGNVVSKISWTEKVGRSVAFHVYDPATARF